MFVSIYAYSVVTLDDSFVNVIDSDHANYFDYEKDSESDLNIFDFVFYDFELFENVFDSFLIFMNGFDYPIDLSDNSDAVDWHCSIFKNDYFDYFSEFWNFAEIDCLVDMNFLS